MVLFVSNSFFSTLGQKREAIEFCETGVRLLPSDLDPRQKKSITSSERVKTRISTYNL